MKEGGKRWQSYWRHAFVLTGAIFVGTEVLPQCLVFLSSGAAPSQTLIPPSGPPPHSSTS